MAEIEIFWRQPEAFMLVKVLFFGLTADLAGCRELMIEVADGDTSTAALDKIRDRFPHLAGYRLLIAVNQQYADGGETVVESDELAVFTAVSGG